MAGIGCCAHGDDSHLIGEDIPVLRSIARVSCLNEAEGGSAPRVFKAHCSSGEKAAYVESAGSDPELLFNIEFSSTVRLTGVCVSAGEAPGTCPQRLRLFANAPALDFGSAADSSPAQELTLPGPDAGGAVWHPVRAAKFNNLTSLQLLFTGRRGVEEEDDEDGHPPVRIYFIGLKGVATGWKSSAVETSYEARPQLSDHAARADAAAGRSLL